ncbi:hypothetical protein HOK021_73430 [Streptomyces hygroscopicus]|nr:hypothetical protein HOK021_73430 [Streptomyces hygroscopicus]
MEVASEATEGIRAPCTVRAVTYTVQGELYAVHLIFGRSGERAARTVAAAAPPGVRRPAHAFRVRS